MPETLSFSQFETKLMKASRPLFNAVLEGAEGDEFKENLGHFLLDGDKMRHQSRGYSSADRYQWLVFSGFAEISASYYTLRDIETLLGSLTSRPSKVMKSRVLAYHVHNYLNENYILKTRLERYPVTILRASKRWPKDRQIMKLINAALSVAFGNIITARGSHVHDTRYTDDDLDRVLMLERMSDTEEELGKAFRKFFQLEFTLSRRKWLERMQKNNDALTELLGAYFTSLAPLIFDDAGKIFIPARIKGA